MKFFLTFILSILLTYSAIIAQNGPVYSSYSNKTTANGLGDNFTNDVYVVGSKVYVATNTGLSISTNGGTSFTNKTTANGLGSNVVLDVYVVNDTIYAATNGGLSISTNGGTSFTTKTTANGLGSNKVADVYVVGSKVYAATYEGLSISTNGGTSFTNKTTANGLAYNIVSGVYVVGNTVYAVTPLGLGVSTNGGTSFTNPTGNYDLFDTPDKVYVVGSTVYLTTYSDLSISTNGGTSFTNKLGGIPLTNVYAIGNTIYATSERDGLYISSDGGTTFTNYTTANGLGVNAARSVFATSSAIYVATFGGLSIGSATLAVELLSFTGKTTEGANLLSWTTASETNNKGFQVERLNQETQDWDALGFKTANQKASNYEFTDDAPLSTSYYRLRQVDNDGHETLSKVLSVQRKNKEKLNVYPNPVSNVLTIGNAENEDFQIHNLLGQMVLSGKNTQRIDVSELPKGAYFLKIGTQQTKFVKQ